MKVVLVTGGFDPLHAGHIACLRQAKALGDVLVVGINSDTWLQHHKGRVLVPMSQRMEVIKNLSMVDAVVVYADSDGSSSDAIRLVQNHYPGAHIIFANGGDRTQENIPEMIFDEVEYVFGLGGNTNQLTAEPATVDRVWGSFRVLHQLDTRFKVKEVTVSPGACLTMQRHEHRSEYWLVTQGRATVYSMDSQAKRFDQSPFLLRCYLESHESLTISPNEWHQLSNETGGLLKLIEIQYGTNCDENDIERIC